MSHSAALSSPSFVSSPAFLRNILRLDALSCIGCGLLQLAFTAQLAALAHLPQVLLGWTGEFLLAYGAVVAILSTRKPPPRAAVWLVFAGNVGWALACVGLLLLDGPQVALPGIAYVMLQAVTVAVLAELQFLCLRRAAW